jgi:hypothetical protein
LKNNADFICHQVKLSITMNLLVCQDKSQEYSRIFSFFFGFLHDFAKNLFLRRRQVISAQNMSGSHRRLQVAGLNG